MCHGRKLNNKLNRLQERALLIVYNDQCSTFYQLLEKDKTLIIQTRNLQYLAIEMFKVKIGISPNIMIEIFKFCDNNTHNLVVKLYNAGIIELMISGVQSISTLGAKI